MRPPDPSDLARQRRVATSADACGSDADPVGTRGNAARAKRQLAGAVSRAAPDAAAQRRPSTRARGGLRRAATWRSSTEPQKPCPASRLKIHRNLITAMIGPSGCGKTTFLRSLNRMNDSVPGLQDRRAGSSTTATTSTAASVDRVEVRRRIGMVFQRPNPFPKSIYDNIAWAPRNLGMKADLDERVERALRGAALWDEVKDRLKPERARPVRRPAAAAVHRPRDRDRTRRAAARRAGVGARPDRDRVDRGADAHAQEPLHDRDRHPQHAAGGARRRPHRLLQPRRRAAASARACSIEYDDTERIFTQPADPRTRDYVTGRFG